MSNNNSRETRSAPGVAGFFSISLLLLICAGLLGRAVFLLFNPATMAETSAGDVLFALGWGLRFDIAAAGFLALFFTIIYWLMLRLRLVSGVSVLKVARGFMAAAITVVLLLQLGDAMYYADAGRHVSYEIRDVLTDASALFLTAITQHWLFILVCFVGGGFLIAGLLRVADIIQSKLTKSWTLPFGVQHEISMIIAVIIAVYCIRGGPGGVPQSSVSAYEIGNPQQAVIAMSGAYNIMYGAFSRARDAQHVAIQLPNNVDVRKEMQSLYPGLPEKHNAQRHNYNVVFILMEGWPAELMHSYGFDKVTTPFFDSLLEKSFRPRGVIAGGRRTTEGIFASMCSQQNPLGQTVARTHLENLPYKCLPGILKKQGWSTAFFQGTHKGTSGTGPFAQRVGFSASYGKEDMPEGRYKRGDWGAEDPDIYDFVLSKLDTMPQPFMIGVNTNSTHSVEIPEGVKAVFGSDTIRHSKLSVMHFADAAMAEFFEKVSKKPYFDNTIFVLMSDHSTGPGYRGFSRYLIPGLIYSKDLTPVKKLDRYVSQRDLAPTVLDILGLNPSLTFSGKSFWKNPGGIKFADFYDAGSVYWLENNMLVQTSIDQPDSGRCFDISNGLLDAPATTCGTLGKKLSLESLAFTSYSQQQLFSGKTEDFFDFIGARNSVALTH